MRQSGGVIWFVRGIVASVLILVALPLDPGRALAVTCGDQAGFNAVEGVSRYGAGASDNHVYNASPSCTVIHGIAAVYDPPNYVVAGWYIDPDGFLPDCNTYTSPHFLQFAVVNNTVFGCLHPSAALNTGSQGSYAMSVTDPGQNGTWHFYLAGSQTGTYSIGFDYGVPQVLDFRYLQGDNLHSLSSGLQYFTSSQTWVNWDGYHPYKDVNASDPVTDWKDCTPSPTYFSVIRPTDTC
jgi:hypothetical protein